MKGVVGRTRMEVEVAEGAQRTEQGGKLKTRRRPARIIGRILTTAGKLAPQDTSGGNFHIFTCWYVNG